MTMMMMMEGNIEALFPVVFFDGERTVDMGCVSINPTMNFKGFQSIISQKIGISPHQITIYLERSPPLLPSHPQSGRRYPVTNKFNFSAAIGERNCAYFFVVSKKSRRVRRRRHRQHNSIDVDDPARQSTTLINYSPERFTLLRRDPNYPYPAARDPNDPNYPYPAAAALRPSYVDQFQQTQTQTQILNLNKNNWYYPGSDDYLDYANKMRSTVEREREKYLMSLNMNSNVYSDLSWLDKDIVGGGGPGSSEITSDDGASSWGGASSTGISCEVCAMSARTEGYLAPPFHCCKLDAVVTVPFRSRAGPISRPPSSSRFSV